MAWAIIIFRGLIHAYRKITYYVDRSTYFHSLMLKAADFLQFYKQMWFRAAFRDFPESLWRSAYLELTLTISHVPQDVPRSVSLGRWGEYLSWVFAFIIVSTNLRTRRNQEGEQSHPDHNKCYSNATNFALEMPPTSPDGFAKGNPQYELHKEGRGIDIPIGICPFNSALKL